MRQAVASALAGTRLGLGMADRPGSRRSSCPTTCATTWPGCCATAPIRDLQDKALALFPPPPKMDPKKLPPIAVLAKRSRRRRQGQGAAGRQRQERHAMPQMPHDPRRRRPGRPRPVDDRQEGQPREPVRVDPPAQQGHRRPVPPVEDRQERRPFDQRPHRRGNADLDHAARRQRQGHENRQKGHRYADETGRVDHAGEHRLVHDRGRAGRRGRVPVHAEDAGAGPGLVARRRPVRQRRGRRRAGQGFSAGEGRSIPRRPTTASPAR